jgi:hypothetical protein
MNITVTVDEVTLDTIVHKGYDEDDGRTLGEEMARQALERLTRDREDGWSSVREHVNRIRDEEIREAVRPLIAEALTKPFRKTNSYGEPVSGETTLSELIAAEAKRIVTQPADSYNRDKGTLLQQTVASAVREALGKEIADEVKRARAEVATQIGAMVATAVAAGMRK